MDAKSPKIITVSKQTFYSWKFMSVHDNRLKIGPNVRITGRGIGLMYLRIWYLELFNENLTSIVPEGSWAPHSLVIKDAVVACLPRHCVPSSTTYQLSRSSRHSRMQHVAIWLQPFKLYCCASSIAHFQFTAFAYTTFGRVKAYSPSC